MFVPFVIFDYESAEAPTDPEGAIEAASEDEWYQNEGVLDGLGSETNGDESRLVNDSNNGTNTSNCSNIKHTLHSGTEAETAHRLFDQLVTITPLLQNHGTYTQLAQNAVLDSLFEVPEVLESYEHGRYALKLNSQCTDSVHKLTIPLPSGSAFVWLVVMTFPKTLWNDRMISMPPQTIRIALGDSISSFKWLSRPFYPTQTDQPQTIYLFSGTRSEESMCTDLTSDYKDVEQCCSAKYLSIYFSGVQVQEPSSSSFLDGGMFSVCTRKVGLYGVSVNQVGPQLVRRLSASQAGTTYKTGRIVFREYLKQMLVSTLTADCMRSMIDSEQRKSALLREHPNFVAKIDTVAKWNSLLNDARLNALAFRGRQENLSWSEIFSRTTSCGVTSDSPELGNLKASETESEAEPMIGFVSNCGKFYTGLIQRSKITETEAHSKAGKIRNQLKLRRFVDSVNNNQQ